MSKSLQLFLFTGPIYGYHYQQIHKILKSESIWKYATELK